MKQLPLLLLALLAKPLAGQHYFAQVATGARAPVTVQPPVIAATQVLYAAGQETPLNVHVNPARGASPAYGLRSNGHTVPVAAGSGTTAFTAAQFGLADFNGRDFDILEGGNVVGQFRTVPAAAAPPAPPSSVATGTGTQVAPPKTVEPMSSFIERIAASARATPYGLQLSSNEFTSYTGRKYVHLFFDQNGSPLLSTVPQGISNYQYVVHVVYLTRKEKPVAISYSVIQTKGEFSDALVFQNMDTGQGVEKSGPQDFYEKDWKWTQSEVLLRTSTNEIEFKIQRNITTINDELPSASTQLVATHTIPMSKVYHGSFDVGLVSSTLENPTFSLVTDPNDPNGMVLKREGGGNRGIVTLMMTFYSSPFMWFKPKGSIPDYKRYGRNFLDDLRWYQRVYPSIGVGISDQAFENLFFGFNWEIVRGGGIWFGYHYGRVRTFDAPEGFEYGKTPITQAEFDLRSDNAWRLTEINKHTDFTPTIGANIDLRLITRLFSGGGSGAPESVTP